MCLMHKKVFELSSILKKCFYLHSIFEHMPYDVFVKGMRSHVNIYDLCMAFYKVLDII